MWVWLPTMPPLWAANVDGWRGGGVGARRGGGGEEEVLVVEEEHTEVKLREALEALLAALRRACRVSKWGFLCPCATEVDMVAAVESTSLAVVAPPFPPTESNGWARRVVVVVVVVVG